MTNERPAFKPLFSPLLTFLLLAGLAPGAMAQAQKTPPQQAPASAATKGTSPAGTPAVAAPGAASPGAAAQGEEGAKEPTPIGSELAISPSRLELEMAPGSSKTVVVKVLRTVPKGVKAEPTRLRVNLNDWELSKDGRVTYAKPGTLANSASPWIVYSPAELVLPAGESLFVRVTISVPKDARPGDHTAALIIEPQPADLKQLTNEKQMVFQFRLASTIYVMVPKLVSRPALRNLKVSVSGDSIEVVPTLANEGNHLVRPLHQIKIYSSEGELVAEQTANRGMPVLGGQELEAPQVLKQTLPPGSYDVRYRVDFEGEISKAIEGRTTLKVGQ